MTPAKKLFVKGFGPLLCSFALSIPLQAGTIENRTAKYYDVGKISEAPIFTQSIVVKSDDADVRTWESEIKDDTGKVIIKETALMNSNEIVSQTMSNWQSQQTCELHVEADKLTFRTYKFADGKRGDLIEEKIRDKDDNFTTGPAVEFYLTQKWDQLSEGRSIEIQFGIFEMMRTIGFQLKKEGETEKLLKVKMSPANFFIKLLVDPIHLQFDKASRRLVHYEGRTPLKRSVNGKPKPWDAEVTYE